MLREENTRAYERIKLNITNEINDRKFLDNWVLVEELCSGIFNDEFPEVYDLCFQGYRRTRSYHSLSFVLLSFIAFKFIQQKHSLHHFIVYLFHLLILQLYSYLLLFDSIILLGFVLTFSILYGHILVNKSRLHGFVRISKDLAFFVLSYNCLTEWRESEFI